MDEVQLHQGYRPTPRRQLLFQELSHFSERLYSQHLGQIRILGENWHFRWGCFFFVVVFFRWDLKTPGIKTREYESQAKKGSDCNFYSFSLLVPCSNTFLVPCTCTLIFHSINSHLPTTIFLCEGLISFFFFFFFSVLQLRAGKI